MSICFEIATLLTSFVKMLVYIPCTKTLCMVAKKDYHLVQEMLYR